METKQHTSKQPMGQRRDQKRNQKIFWNKWNGNTIYQNLWDAAVPREKFMVINKYIKKLERFQINNFTPEGTRKRIH